MPNGPNKSYLLNPRLTPGRQRKLMQKPEELARRLASLMLHVHEIGKRITNEPFYIDNL